MSGTSPRIALSDSFDLRATIRSNKPIAAAAVSPGLRDVPPDGPSDHDYEETQSQSSGKRQRRLTTTDFTRRKRAVTACQFCRVRKTKCDNVRPTCSFCVRHRAKCVYADTDNDVGDEGTEDAVSNRQILDRLNEIKEILEKSDSSPKGFPVAGPLFTTADTPQTPAATSPWARFSTGTQYQTQTSSRVPPTEVERLPFAALRCESLLRWPALYDAAPSDARDIDSFPLSPGELVFELGLRPSALESFSYPEPLPSPPEGLLTEQTPRTEGSQVDPDEEQRQVDERGWYYYLSEISIRRTVDETLNLLYRNGEEYWMKNPLYLIRQYHECEQQISQWHYHLPAVVQFESDKLPDQEFAAALQGRASLWREYTLRPIFYYVLHHQSNEPIPPQAHTLAIKELEICATVVHRLAFHRRHGGIWLISRKIFLCACLILVAALNPDRVQPPEQWHIVVEIAIQALERWAPGAIDVQRMADILRHIYSQT
ncbi:hypothetical protein NW762_000139 [Fusarium torreyae]|uniref:Zn(2)-C6 fungal-type domain-containing protein n=1 Tax=Fusarium torreyae TaxID=1237075 RepID=A0A9W8SFR9_9HYPO|nr:hypothetical protein NW762_000139 [Fusarium torreyae]